MPANLTRAGFIVIICRLANGNQSQWVFDRNVGAQAIVQGTIAFVGGQVQYLDSTGAVIVTEQGQGLTVAQAIATNSGVSSGGQRSQQLKLLVFGTLINYKQIKDDYQSWISTRVPPNYLNLHQVTISSHFAYTNSARTRP